MEIKIISTKIQEEDIKIESSLRPQTLNDYIGQEKAKKNLKIYNRNHCKYFNFHYRYGII